MQTSALVQASVLWVQVSALAKAKMKENICDSETIRSEPSEDAGALSEEAGGPLEEAAALSEGAQGPPGEVADLSVGVEGPPEEVLLAGDPPDDTAVLPEEAAAVCEEQQMLTLQLAVQACN